MSGSDAPALSMPLRGFARRRVTLGISSAMKIVLRLIAIVVLFCVAAFCAFGFLASYELASAMARLPWQIIYGLGGGMALVGVARNVQNLVKSK